MMARCERCGTPFECRPGHNCWCEAVAPRLPLRGATCLCPACLAAAVKAAEKAGAKAR